MTMAMTTTPPASRPPAPLANAGAMKARKVADTLAAIRAKHLAIFDAWGPLVGHYPLTKIENAMRGAEASRLWLPKVEAHQPRDEVERSDLIARANMLLASHPADAIIDGLEDRTLDLLADVNSAQVRVIVALMVDAFPNARPHSPETYLETVISELSHVPTGVVAKATNVLVRRSTFLPAIAEVVDEAATAQSYLRAGTTGAADRIEQRDYIRSVRDWLETVQIYLVNDPSTYERGPERPAGLWRTSIYGNR